MDPSPKSHPILSYVLARLPSLGAKHSSSSSSSSTSPTAVFDIEQPSPAAQPRPTDPSSSSSPSPILAELPHLTNPKVLSEMTRAIVDVAQTRSVLQTLGSRPDHESVDAARVKLAEYEFNLSKQLEDLVLSPRPTDVDTMEWRAHLAEREKQLRDAADKEKSVYKAVLQLEELHVAYEKLLREVEQKLVKIYKKAERGGDEEEEEEEEKEEGTVGAKVEEVNEEVVGILRQVNDEKLGLERVDLSNRKLRLLPEAFGRIQSLKVLNLSNNLLEVIPDSIAGLHHLEELNLSSNLLESLPDTIGLLYNLKILNVSSNKLEALPDSISHCRSLIELDVSFNRLTYLPTNIGYELANLQRLSAQLNKLRSFPTSIGEMKCLRQLDAHFNELCGLPFSIGNLTNLEVLNLSNNFSDLRELPESFGDLIGLKELDLSNNQIQALPDSFGRLDNLTKLNLDQNPLVLPPPEVVNGGVEAVKTFMAKRWLDVLVEEERKSMLEVQEEAQTGWLTRSTSWLKTYAAGVSESVSGYLSPRSSTRDPFLDQQL